VGKLGICGGAERRESLFDSGKFSFRTHSMIEIKLFGRAGGLEGITGKRGKRAFFSWVIRRYEKGRRLKRRTWNFSPSKEKSQHNL